MYRTAVLFRRHALVARNLCVCRKHGQLSVTYGGRRSYHSKHGVYGYQPRLPKVDFKVSDSVIANRASNANLLRLVTAYRENGHKTSKLDPLGLLERREVAELDPKMYGLSTEDTTEYNLEGILNIGKSSATLKEILEHLESIYCGTISAEFSHVEDIREREWLSNNFEELQNYNLSAEEKKELGLLLAKSQEFDLFTAVKFTTVKRYGGEGAESMQGFFHQVFKEAAQNEIEQVVMCMPHRGRNNVLTGLLKFPPMTMYRKMRGLSEFPENVQASGDVLSHLTNSVDLQFEDKSVHVTMIPNPSHLEANIPVAVGKTRARQQSLKDGDYSNNATARLGDKVLCLQVHGDAAFCAQGIVAENFNMAYCPHFDVGGSLHLIVNNQLGFTTESQQGRSSMYCSDVSKIVNCPIIHVNGDHPEDVVRACKLAMDYRQEFRKDVIVDLVCFRRWGHNEIDDPTFTQPLMYNVIHNRRSVPDEYLDQLEREGVCKKSEITSQVAEYHADLNQQLSRVDQHVPTANHLEKQWSGFIQAPAHITMWDTGVDKDILKFVGGKSVDVPPEVEVHAKLAKAHIGARLQKIQEGSDIDWATAEAFAIGSLLFQGFNARISGQDVGRGTFSHRHAMLVDQKTDKIHIPLNHMVEEQQGFLEVANSSLSELAVLAFEYGMSIESPNSLTIWEAQFGDFFNGAQVIIDTYVTTGETKWLLQSGLVMLLPHGMDGAGPEHSSCRMERFLLQCDSKENGIDGDNVNIQIVNPTTPAQYFHLLRRQMVRNYRKPLVVVAPKILLRLPAATSDLKDMMPGTSFKPVVGDNKVNPAGVSRVLFVTGKHYYALAKQREALKADNVAIIRVESLCPFPAVELRQEVQKYSKAKEFIWCQEEHQNSGAWTFVNPRFQNNVGIKLAYVGRGPLATPAVGIAKIHQEEAKDVIQKPFQ
ncbi:2-oxoadipate dehydrogenase complex component E1-like [Ptychodera flava]|uniref:2-oxoadipate dehydrogenase complex component E1-like n=1 Tax=Ptychodera flava TaxID=63121 RepID=UPI00396A68D0